MYEGIKITANEQNYFFLTFQINKSLFIDIIIQNNYLKEGDHSFCYA
jgi:hypothetical protein